jgi:hypothetical protein
MGLIEFMSNGLFFSGGSLESHAAKMALAFHWEFVTLRTVLSNPLFPRYVS